MNEETGPVAFKEATTIRPSGSHEYKVNIHEDWSYGQAAHGGSLISLVWKTVWTHFQTTLAKYNQPDTISLHVEFLRLAVIGDATISIKDVRLGKGSSTVHASLTQGGKERVAAYAMYVVAFPPPYRTSDIAETSQEHQLLYIEGYLDDYRS